MKIDGARRTEIGTPPEIEILNEEIFIEKEPIAILLSEMGWLRAVKPSSLESTKYKEGDKERFVVSGHTTDKLLCFSTHGKFYTISCDKIPRGKGWGSFKTYYRTGA